MKICLLSMEYPPYPSYVAAGGVGTYTYYLCNQLKKRGHEVHVIACGERYNTEMVRGINVHRIKSVPIRMVRVPVYSIMASMELRKLIRKSNFDIVHNQSPYGFFEAYLNVLKEHSTFISTIHAVPSRYLSALQFGSRANLPEITQKIGSIVPKILFNKIEYAASNQIIAVSNFVRDDLVNVHEVSAKKIEVIHNGVDIQKFRPILSSDARKVLKLPMKSKIILYVGRLIKLKGVDLLIKSASELIRRYGDVYIIIVGTGCYEDELIRMSRNISKNVSFVQTVSHDVLPLYYSAADLVVIPSLYEGAPFVLLEAMASSRAILTTNIPPITEFVDETTAVLLNRYEPKEFIDKVSLLLSDESYRQMLGKKARARLLDKFTWEKTVEKTEQVYKRAIDDMIANSHG